MSEPYFTPAQKAQHAIGRAHDRLMANLMQGDAKLAHRNFRDWKKQQDGLEYAQLEERAAAEKAEEHRKLREFSRLIDQRESSRAILMEARPLVAKIEKFIEALGWNYEMLLRLADSAYAEAPASEKPRVGHAKLKDGSLANALLVALQKAGIPVLKETDALRNQPTFAATFESGAAQISQGGKSHE